MGAIEATFGLLLAALIIALLAKRVDKPYPIALVLGGGALGMIPSVPRIQPDPSGDRHKRATRSQGRFATGVSP